MSGEKNIEASELIASGPISDSPLNLSEKDMEKKGIPSNSFSSSSAMGDAVSRTKVVDQPSALEQSVYYPPTSCYDYYYPVRHDYTNYLDSSPSHDIFHASGETYDDDSFGISSHSPLYEGCDRKGIRRYNGTFGQPDDKGYYNAASGSYAGIQSDNNSLLYYYPGYSPYQTGTDYLQQSCSYGSDAFPCYSYDSTYSGNVSTGPAARSSSVKPVLGPSGSGKSNGYNIPKTNANFSSKASMSPFNSKVQQSSKSIYQNHHLKPSNKLGSSFQSTGLMKGYQSASKLSAFTNQHPDFCMQYSPVNFQSNGRAWNNNYRNKSRETMGKHSEFEALTELTRGPRSDTRNNSPAAIKMDKYNSQEFQIKYDNAKFYVIKSYSEDDVHKCIKYDVWSSTPNGNKKLDAAFREADAKTSETGKKCPVFLFFSVNGSGQFVGVAEMIGQVDFSKNMDFWQLDKWNGFFPIKWHIIKDVPNTLLRHIILENNENRPVTYSRDTQEIGLKQGSEMLSIFKNYVERTSVLDDFNFYENREKSLKAKRNSKPASKNGDYNKYFEAGEGMAREQAAKAAQSDPSSLISLTKNLTIGSPPLKSSI